MITTQLVRLIVLAMCVLLVAAQDFGAKTERSSAIKDALADSIRLRAEAKKEKAMFKHGGSGSQASTAAAKTKSFAYTSIQVPGGTLN